MTRPLKWMAAVRDHPERPPAMQRYVLYSLALRMDWQTSAGFASTGQLAADADCDERTVKRSTRWGRDHKMLVQARRGHRLGDGRAVASEWRLTLAVDSQQDTGVPLKPASRGQRAGLNGTAGASQGDTTTPPSRTRSSRPSSSARGRASADGARAGAPGPITAPPCDICRKPFSQEQLADPDFYAMAMAGEVIHDGECTAIEWGES